MSRDESCDWYHGKISRIDAENILLEGDYRALTSNQNNEVWLQIIWSCRISNQQFWWDFPCPRKFHSCQQLRAFSVLWHSILALSDTETRRRCIFFDWWPTSDSPWTWRFDRILSKQHDKLVYETEELREETSAASWSQKAWKAQPVASSYKTQSSRRC